MSADTEDEYKDYPFGEFPEKGSDWETVKQARCMAIAEFRNIIDDCDNHISVSYEETRRRCKTHAIHGLRHLGAEL